ncbi:DUF72 domain-containing protein [Streptomyces hebeiensis]|uniref:DUF72 domain-containing protein n=1 Tax=Streptomyces hebeiensis TaxID=229486 RepID=A0ABN1V8N8_9ACTN
MGEILVGTCSWTDRALLASGWYPPGRRDAAGRLRHYAERFPVVEVDATYYALPSVRNSRLWAERTPPGFRFDVKAFSLLTGHPTRPEALPADLREAFRRQQRPGPGRRDGADRDANAATGAGTATGTGTGGGADSGTDGGTDGGLLDEIWRRFSGALEPLRRTGRLGTLLFQFPPWLAPGPRAEAFLDRCRERTAGWPVAVEFRHPGWWRADRLATTSAFLADRDMTAVAVDMAQSLATSVPPVSPVTSRRLAMTRFHGRSGAWGTGTKEERFRHTYAPEELAEWVPRLRAMADEADAVHVMFNNCCADASVRAAVSMRRLLDEAAHRRPGPGLRR